MGDAASGHQSCRQSVLLRFFEYGEAFFSFSAYRYGAVECFAPAGKGGGASGGIGDQMRAGMGGHQARDREFLEVEFFTVSVVPGADLG